MVFVVTGPRGVFIYADSAANRGPRPTIIAGRESNVIIVRATTELMGQIAKVIADNDKK